MSLNKNSILGYQLQMFGIYSCIALHYARAPSISLQSARSSCQVKQQMAASFVILEQKEFFIILLCGLISVFCAEYCIYVLHSFFYKNVVFPPRLNILIFLPILG